MIKNETQSPRQLNATNIIRLHLFIQIKIRFNYDQKDMLRRLVHFCDILRHYKASGIVRWCPAVECYAHSESVSIEIQRDEASAFTRIFNDG